MLPRIRKLLLMLTFRLAHKRRLSLLIKLIPCLLLVTYVVSKISPIVSEDQRSIGYDYQRDQTAFQQPTQPPLNNNYLTPNALRAFINSTNDQQIILNLDKYGSLTPGDPIIIVQVHDRVEYLKFLIKSLETVQGIDKALLILTHDVYNPIINSIVKSIGFCKVIQLFYPFSIQAYPNEFPGTDPRDCPRDIKQQEAIALHCQNAEHPDTYGHYREAVYTQTKHHWFWKMNTIFDKLNATKEHDGPFIFLEEDHYAAPDMLHVLKSMMDLKLRSELDVDLFTLGAYVKVFNYLKNSDKLEINKWASNLHNMGFVLSRSVWNKIRLCAKNFCTYDDYNWDWSLQHISEKCMTRPLKTLSVIAPRVFHIGECGVHHKKSDCSKNELINRVRQTLKAAANYLFPSQLIVQKTTKRSTKMSKVNGGWADIRDHILCLQQVLYVDKMEEF